MEANTEMQFGHNKPVSQTKEDESSTKDGEASSGGCESAAVQDRTCRGWYRPEQHRKGRRGRGHGTKKSKKSQKKGNKGKAPQDKESTADKIPVANKPDMTVCEIMDANRPPVIDPDDEIETVIATPCSRAMPAFRNIAPPNRTAGGRSNSDPRPASTPANQTAPLFADRPRNRPRTVINRRRGAPSRYENAYEDFDGFSLPSSIMEDMIFIRMILSLNDPDSD